MSPASAESDFESGDEDMKRTKGLLGDIWRILGGGSSNTGSAG